MKTYEPYFVESVSKADLEDGEYIFDVIPPTSKTTNQLDENDYYELHLKIENHIINYKDFLQDYIHIEIIDRDTVEIYEGEFYEESFSDGSFKFEFIELKKKEKDFKSEWKPKAIKIKRDFEKLFNEKIADYSKLRNIVVNNYNEIYEYSLDNLQDFNLNVESISTPYVFKILHKLFYNNPASDGLNKLLDPDYVNQKQIKSWKQDFERVNAKFEKLKNTDVTDYDIIKNHIADIYIKTYNHLMVSANYNYKEIEKDKYDTYFQYLMTELKKTTKQ
jgi:hypothetical protein